MGSGLLETLLARLEALNARLEHLEGNGVTLGVVCSDYIQGEMNETTNTTDVASEATNSTVATTTPVNGVELDKDGVPWDARIHSSTKAKTTKDVWKRRKGVTDLEFAQITEELKAAASSTVSAPETTTAPETTNVNATAPSKPGTPHKPSMPNTPSKPGTPAGAATNTQPLIPLIDRITGFHGVSPMVVSAELKAKFGVEFVNNLNADQIEECKVWLTGWVDYLDDIADVIGDISDMDAARNGADGLFAGVGLYLQQHGSTDGKLGTVPKGQLSELFTVLNKYCSEWSNYYKSQQ